MRELYGSGEKWRAEFSFPDHFNEHKFDSDKK